MHNFLRVGRKFLIGGISLCKGSTIIPAISELSSANIFSINSISLKGATKTSDFTLSGIPALSGTACGKLLNFAGARLICASEHIP